MKKFQKWLLLLGVISGCTLLGICRMNSVKTDFGQVSGETIMEFEYDGNQAENPEPAEASAEKEASEAKKEPVEEPISAMAEKPEKTPEVCVVYVCGAVMSPGVYNLPEGSRIYEAIEMAGGFADEADSEYLNQAGNLQDGMKLYVPTKEQVEKNEVPTEQGNGDSLLPRETADDGRVNINTATEGMLCTLPGIGTSKAKSIISYREEHGAYEQIEDIMKVTGIKEGLFQKIRDKITV